MPGTQSWVVLVPIYSEVWRTYGHDAQVANSPTVVTARCQHQDLCLSLDITSFRMELFGPLYNPISVLAEGNCSSQSQVSFSPSPRFLFFKWVADFYPCDTIRECMGRKNNVLKGVWLRDQLRASHMSSYSLRPRQIQSRASHTLRYTPPQASCLKEVCNGFNISLQGTIVRSKGNSIPRSSGACLFLSKEPLPYHC